MNVKALGFCLSEAPNPIEYSFYAKVRLTNKQKTDLNSNSFDTYISIWVYRGLYINVASSIKMVKNIIKQKLTTIDGGGVIQISGPLIFIQVLRKFRHAISD